MNRLLLKSIVRRKISRYEKLAALYYLDKAELIDRTRYLCRGKYFTRSDHEFTWHLYEDRERAFLSNFRISREKFHEIVGLIKDNEVFQTSNKKKQAPVEFQMMVFFKYIGTKGCTYQQMRSFFRIGLGTVVLFIRRVCKALHDMKGKVIYWPSDGEKTLIKDYYGRHFHWHDCVGTIDGTCVVLYCKPTLHGEDYFDRKNSYSVNLQVVIDPDGRVRYLFCGPPGSQHDSTCLRWSKMGKYPHHFFQGYEHLLADSAYINSRWMICNYKKPRNTSLPVHHRLFNWALSKPRTKSECAFGWWKGRFPFFECARINLRSVKDMTWLCELVTASFVVQNLLVGSFLDDSFYVRDPYMDIADDYPAGMFDDDLNPNLPESEARARSHNYLHAHNYFRGVKSRVYRPTRT